MEDFEITWSEWADLRARKYSKVAPPPDWPEGVRPISVEGVGLFGIDTDGQLYWDGKRVETVSRLSLTRRQRIVAGAAALGTAFGGFAVFMEWLLGIDGPAIAAWVASFL